MRTELSSSDFCMHHAPIVVLGMTVAFNSMYGGDIGKVADDSKQRLSFSPAGWTFSIWGVIYATMAYVCFEEAEQKVWTQQAVGLFTMSCVMNCAWIVAWTSKYTRLSQVLLYGIVGSLFLLWHEQGPSQSTTLSHADMGCGESTESAAALPARFVSLLSQNCIAIYVAWTLGASILNTCTSLKLHHGISDKRLSQGALATFCALQLAWPTLFSHRHKESVPVALVGAWTCVGILRGDGVDAGMWKYGLGVTAGTSLLSLRTLYQIL